MVYNTLFNDICKENKVFYSILNISIFYFNDFYIKLKEGVFIDNVFKLSLYEMLKKDNVFKKGVVI